MPPTRQGTRPQRRRAGRTRCGARRGERAPHRRPGRQPGAAAAAGRARRWGCQYYFATERGRAGYERYRRDFGRDFGGDFGRDFGALIWRAASPRWAFDAATFARRVAAFDNPDHVALVIHNYRRRRRTRTRAPTPTSSPAGTSTGPSRAA